MKVAVAQMTSGKDYKENFITAENLVNSASKQGVKLILLPEMFACIGVNNQSELAASVFTKVQLELSIGSWAKRNSIYIVAGSVPFSSPVKGKVFAASMVFSPEGRVIGHYNKVHLFDVDVADEKGHYRESDTFEPGQTPVVVNIDNLKLGLTVCYDLRFPELYQVYQKQNCQLMTVPSAFTYKTGKMHWETLLKARAIETQAYVLAANQCGIHEDGRRTWGHSMIVSPNGEILAVINQHKVGIAVADLDIEAQDLIKKAMPLLNHKRL
jgi:predicted amidohydrolase